MAWLSNKKEHNAHTAPLCSRNQLSSHFRCLWNFLNYNLCTISSTKIYQCPLKQEDHRILRSHTELFIPPSRLTSTEKFPLFSFPHTWCTFPDAELKNILNKNLFNSKLKTHFLSSLPSIYVCNRLFCHTCRLQT